MRPNIDGEWHSDLVKDGVAIRGIYFAAVPDAMVFTDKWTYIKKDIDSNEWVRRPFRPSDKEEAEI